MNFVIIKAVTGAYGYMYFYNYEYNASDQKNSMLKICLSYLQLLIMSISFVSMTCISHCQICCNKGVFSRC